MPDALISIGALYGDEGKATTDEALHVKRESFLGVRFQGGPQTAHNVISGNRHHTFAQIASGSFVPGVATYLSPFMLIEPRQLLDEAKHLESVGVPEIFRRLYIDRDAVVITPFHIAANQLKEVARGGMAHGSCGTGVWETESFARAYPLDCVRASDLLDRETLLRKLCFVYEAKAKELKELLVLYADDKRTETAIDTFRNWNIVIQNAAELYQHVAKQVMVVDITWFAKRMRTEETVIFEGAQGVLLDENFGFHPNTTGSTTTYKNAISLLQEIGYHGSIVKVAVLRSYMTRHGFGIFVSEDPALSKQIPDMHNGTGTWQGSFRIGYLDFVALNYSFAVSGKPDFLSLTCLDRIKEMPTFKICTKYKYEGDTNDLTGYLEHDGCEVTNIIPYYSEVESIQLERQARLTQLLSRCSPIYQLLSKDTDSYLSLVQEKLQVPIGIASFGPRYEDKQFLNGFG
jgi:adenylosuccinate synthase